MCGTENPYSVGMKWFVKDEGLITGTISLSKQQQGPPDFAHGGASAALLDEAMGAAVWYAGYYVMAVNLNITFSKPIPLVQEIRVNGFVVEIEEGEKQVIQAAGEILLPNGEVGVTAIGTYVSAPQFFDKFIKFFPKE